MGDRYTDGRPVKYDQGPNDNTQYAGRAPPRTSLRIGESSQTLADRSHLFDSRGRLLVGT